MIAARTCASIALRSVAAPPIGGPVAETVRGLADLIAAGGVIGGFLVGAWAVARGYPYERITQSAGIGGILGGALGAFAYVLDRVLGG